MGGSTARWRMPRQRILPTTCLAGVEFLKGQKEIHVAQIGLIGAQRRGHHRAAGRQPAPRDIAFIVLLAGTGLPGDEILYLQGAAILKVAGQTRRNSPVQKTLQERMFAVSAPRRTNALAEKEAAVRPSRTSHPTFWQGGKKNSFLDAQPFARRPNSGGPVAVVSSFPGLRSAAGASQGHLSGPGPESARRTCKWTPR